MHGLVPNDGKPIPPVDPEALRRRWSMKEPWSSEAMQDARVHEEDFPAIFRRDRMVRMLLGLNGGQLLAPWRRGDRLDDAVFRVAATFPMRELQQRVYKIAGDEIFGFDPNAFVQQLIDETGISHNWEPIPTRIAEGSCSFTFVTATFKGQGSPDPQVRRDSGQAKRFTREVLWDVWSKHHRLEPPDRVNQESFARMVATLFADFVIDNVDLAPQLMSMFSGKGEGAQPFAILTELERRAKAWKP
jgi:hypothetical protein